jgi:C1A family cysteine protease
VGFGHDKDGSYILVRNSWGLRWGVQGHGWLHDAYLEPLMVTTGVLS